MSRQICELKQCTGCGACRDICPKHCISMLPDSLDALYPAIDDNKCVNCRICETVCPNNCQITYRKTRRVLAAWSRDHETRLTSASGGVASELYKYWINHGGVAAGVTYNTEDGCHFKLIENIKDIHDTQNSKYTFSNTSNIFSLIKEKLLRGVPVLFIGVPCQVAGLYGYLRKEYKHLTTVDIICHGMPPEEYLTQHLMNIEKKTKEKTARLYFRDPKYNTHTYTFTLSNQVGKEFYRKNVISLDNYQLGYHRSLIYRENCYSCTYARPNRIADLTIGDFSGLGRFAPFEYDNVNVNCVLENTDKGARLLEELVDSLVLIERPREEAFDVEKQLRFPSVKHDRRLEFECIYKKTKNFVLSSDVALKTEKRKVILKIIYLYCKQLARAILVFFHLKKK